MEMRQEQRQRQRAAPHLRKQTSMQARQDELRQWEREWRDSLTGQVRDISKNSADMALVVREMQGDVKELMEWKADQDRRKNDSISAAPDNKRADYALAVSVSMALIYLLQLISLHWK